MTIQVLIVNVTPMCKISFSAYVSIMQNTRLISKASKRLNVNETLNITASLVSYS